MQFKSGATRWVFLIGSIAIKLPRASSWKSLLHGMLANMQEAQWRDMHYALCPIICAAPLGLVVVMKRARPLTAAEWRRLNYTRFVERPHMRLPVERKRDSFGWLGGAEDADGRVVAVDYGS